jgi:hypothetical protein
MDDGQVVAGGLLVAGSDAPKGLERVEADLDEIAVAIELLVVAANLRPGRVRGNDVLAAAVVDGLPNMPGVVARIGDARTPLGLLKERMRHGRLVLLPRRQLDVQRQAFQVDDRVDFGRSTQKQARRAGGRGSSEAA